MDKLNLRDQASTKGKIIDTVNNGDALKLTENKSQKMETVVLRGVAYSDYWYKVLTSDGKEGWVFGGAVKREMKSKEMTLLLKRNSTSLISESLICPVGPKQKKLT